MKVIEDLTDLAQPGYKWFKRLCVNIKPMKSHDELVEELRDSMLMYDEEIVLDALVSGNIVDAKTGMLTEWWLNLLSPEFLKNRLKTISDIVQRMLE